MTDGVPHKTGVGARRPLWVQGNALAAGGIA
jgi:hypothetical protein